MFCYIRLYVSSKPSILSRMKSSKWYDGFFFCGKTEEGSQSPALAKNYMMRRVTNGWM